MEISKSHYLFGDLRESNLNQMFRLENLFSEVEVVCFSLNIFYFMVDAQLQHKLGSIILFYFICMKRDWLYVVCLIAFLVEHILFLQTMQLESLII